MGEGVTKRVEAAVLGLGADPVGALGSGGIEDAGDDFGADAGLKVGAGDGAGDGGAGQAGDEVFTDVGGEAVFGGGLLRGVPVYGDERTLVVVRNMITKGLSLRF